MPQMWQKARVLKHLRGNGGLFDGVTWPSGTEIWVRGRPRDTMWEQDGVDIFGYETWPPEAGLAVKADCIELLPEFTDDPGGLRGAVPAARH